MKKYHKLFFLFLIGILIIPCSVKAVNYGEAYLVGETILPIGIVRNIRSAGKIITCERSNPVTRFVWTVWLDAEGNNRYIAYNKFDDRGDEIEDQLSENHRRWSTVDTPRFPSILVDEQGEEAIPYAIYHGNYGERFEEPSAMGYCSTFWEGLGWYTPEVPFFGPDCTSTVYPKGCLKNRNIIFTATTFEEEWEMGSPLLYWEAAPGEFPEDNDWEISYPIEIDRVAILGWSVCGGENRAAIAWHHNRPGFPMPEEYDGSVAWHINNDIYMIESVGDERLDIDNPINITKTISPDPELGGVHAYGDTLRPYSEMDMVYDGEVLHVVFTTTGMWLAPDPEEELVERINIHRNFIWHWDSVSDTLTLVADGWSNIEQREDIDPHPNVWSPSLGIDEDGILYCAYNGLIDAGENYGYPLGEVMLSISQDEGESWSTSINLSGTAPENEIAREYIDELTVSLAENVDDYLHLFYELYLSNPWAEEREGNVPAKMIYQRIPVEDLPDLEPLELPRVGFQYHNYPPVGIVEDDRTLPIKFELYPAFPNPFNSATNISYSLPISGQVSLIVYNLYGQQIRTLFDGHKRAGVYSTPLTANNLPSGLYFVRLKPADKSFTQKVMLIK